MKLPCPVSGARSAGGIVLGDGGAVAFVLSKNSASWLFPKGHVEPGEDDEAAARREIAEEAGLTELEYLEDLGSFTRPGAGNFQEKHIHMYLFAAPHGARLAPSMEILEARWIPFSSATAVLGSPHEAWFGADCAWFAKVYPRVQEVIQRR